MNNSPNINELLELLRVEIQEAQRKASLADAALDLVPIEDVSSAVRRKRKEQGLTLHDLCDLSDVSYTTLSKIEKGNPSVRLDLLNRVVKSLGMKIWVG